MLITLIFLALLMVGSFVLFHCLSRAFAKEADVMSKDDYYSERAVESQRAKARTLKTLKWVISGVLAVIIVLLFVFSGIKILDTTEIGVVKTFGEVSHTINGGLNFVNPITDTVEIYDLRVHVKEASFASYTKDAQPVTAAIEYQYELEPSAAMTVATQFGNYETLETKLANVVEERAKIVFARYGAMPLLENRSNLSAEVRAEVELLEQSFPVNFTSVVVRDIDFSDAFEAAVEQKMQAEQNALRAENEKKEAITRAEQAKAVAEIEAEAAIAKARGEAEALAITREALENMPDTWIAQLYLERWDGKLPQFITGDGAGVMITPNMD